MAAYLRTNASIEASEALSSLLVDALRGINPTVADTILGLSMLLAGSVSAAPNPRGMAGAVGRMVALLVEANLEAARPASTTPCASHRRERRQ